MTDQRLPSPAPTPRADPSGLPVRFDGVQYCYPGYRYDRRKEALAGARLDIGRAPDGLDDAQLAAERRLVL